MAKMYLVELQQLRLALGPCNVHRHSTARGVDEIKLVHL